MISGGQRFSSTGHVNTHERRRMRILHLSDLHFGTIPTATADHTSSDRAGRSAHFFVKGAQPDPLRLAAILKNDLTSTVPDVIAVSGDIG